MEKKKDDFIKKIIIVMAIFLLAFTIVILYVFYMTGGSEPSTLIVSVFAACMGEYSICGLIKTTKEKQETLRSNQSPSTQETEDDIEEIELDDVEEDQ